MEDKVLLKAALIASILGVLMLYYILEFSEVEEGKVSLFNDESLGDRVLVKGDIIDIVNFENSKLIKINTKEKLDIFVFDDFLNLEKGDKVEVIGKVEKYNNNFEVIADEIRYLG